jgi:hypothetical protein
MSTGREWFAVAKDVALAVLDVLGLPLLTLALGWQGGAKYGCPPWVSPAIVLFSFVMILTRDPRKKLNDK